MVKTPESKASMQLPEQKNWNLRYAIIIALLAVVWWLAYSNLALFSQWLTYDVLGLAKESHLGGAIEFFIYDTPKILLLLAGMIYAIGWLRAALNVERVRDFLSGKRRAIGYLLGSGFGAVTPFCSCSSIPLFMGFCMARIPIGITMAFLITSPLVNEIAIVLLWTMLGWKFTVIYVSIGILSGVIGGWFMDRINAGRWLQPFLLDALQYNQTQTALVASAGSSAPKMNVQERHNFAYSETVMIFKRVWMWVVIGVGLGAALHGFVPEDWFTNNLGAGQWWSVPVAVAVAIPLYTNVTGIVPVMQSLIMKGLPLGTTLAFCMSMVVASLPEVLMLKQVMRWKLIAAFLAYLMVTFTLVGWLFNFLEPWIH